MELCTVYAQSNLLIGEQHFPNAPRYEQQLFGEQVLYDQFRELFYDLKGFCAVWSAEGRCKAALRLIPYRDGYLLTGLETAPDAREQGYAKLLLEASCLYLRDIGCKALYSHVDKRNLPSLRVHVACVFERVLEHAVFLDGSVVNSHCTFFKCI